MADDGLNWDLSLDADTAGASAFLSKLDSVDQTLRRIDQKLRGTEDATRSAGDAHREHGRQAEKLGGVFHNLIHSGLDPFLERVKQIAEFEFIRRGVDALLEAPAELISKVKELGEEMLITAGKAERSENAFALLFGKEGAKEQLEYIEKIRLSSEFTEEQLKNQTLELAKVGFQGEGLRRALAAAHDIAAFSANPDEGASSALGALERIKRSGRVDNRVLGGLGLGEKDFLGELARRTGKSAGELKKALDQGKVDAEQSLEALYALITKKTNEDLGGAGSDAGKLFEARLKHVKELPELFFEGIRHSEGFGDISDFLGKIAEQFAPDSPFGQQVQQSLDSLVDFVGEKFKDIDLDGVLEKAIHVLDEMPDAITAVEDTMKTLWEAFQPIVHGFELVAGIVDKLNAVSGDDSKTAGEAAARAENPELFAKQDELRQRLHIARVAKAAGLPFSEYSGEGPFNDVGEYAARGLEKGSGRAARAGETVAGAFEQGARGRLKIHSPSLVFEDLGMMSAEGFARGVDRGSDVVAAAVGSSLAPSAGAAGAGGGGNFAVTVNLTVNAGDGGPEVGRVVADKLDEILPSALQSAFEQLQVQAGAR